MRRHLHIEEEKKPEIIVDAKLWPMKMAELWYGSKPYLSRLNREHGGILVKVGGRTFLDTKRFEEIGVPLESCI